MTDLPTLFARDIKAGYECPGYYKVLTDAQPIANDPTQVWVKIKWMRDEGEEPHFWFADDDVTGVIVPPEKAG